MAQVHRVVTGEHNPFWVTLFFWCRFDGAVGDIPPCVIHKAAQMRGDLAHGLPMQPGREWLVRASESGYLTKDDWFLVCAHFQLHCGRARPLFVFFDGFVNHWDPDALELLIKDEIYVFCLKSQVRSGKVSSRQSDSEVRSSTSSGGMKVAVICGPFRIWTKWDSAAGDRGEVIRSGTRRRRSPTHSAAKSSRWGMAQLTQEDLLERVAWWRRLWRPRRTRSSTGRSRWCSRRRAVAASAALRAAVGRSFEEAEELRSTDKTILFHLLLGAAGTAGGAGIGRPRGAPPPPPISCWTRSSRWSSSTGASGTHACSESRGGGRGTACSMKAGHGGFACTTCTDAFGLFGLACRPASACVRVCRMGMSSDRGTF
ncbi:hypothetical protein OAO87_04170 [bacterium]|nr:hypothetical protein [bacterium]